VGHQAPERPVLTNHNEVTTVKINVQFLTSRNACSDQVKLFRKTFPKGAVINEDNLRRAHLAGLSLHWLNRWLRGRGGDETIPYARIERTPETRAFLKLDRQQDRELEQVWRTGGRKRDAEFRKMQSTIRKLQRNRDLSPNEVVRLEKVERKLYKLRYAALHKAERQAERDIKRKYAAPLRKLRRARNLSEANILIPVLMGAVTVYRAEQARKRALTAQQA
jgi:hypothetical protein